MKQINKRSLSVQKELGIKYMGMETKSADLAALEDMGYTAQEIEDLRNGK